MRFEATKSDLIAEARAALAAADRERRASTRPRASHPLDLASRPADAAGNDDEARRRERQRVIDDIAAELAAIDESALDRARDSMEAAIDRYVTACVVYNRILAEIRQQLRGLGVSEEEITYHSETGRSGLQVKDVVRLQALPWQTVSRVALKALRTHAPVEPTSLDAPPDNALDILAADPDARPEREEAEPAAVQPAIDEAQLESLFDEKIAPVLAFVRDQQAEITTLRQRLDQQTQEIEQLREQVRQQTASAERVAAYFDALREAQTRLQ